MSPGSQSSTPRWTAVAPARPEDQVLVLFGATGDLAKRKLLPGLFHLAVAELMPERYRIVGSGRPGHDWDTDKFQAHVRKAVDQFGRGELTDENWMSFAEKLSFATASSEQPGPLVEAVASAEGDLGGGSSRLIDLAVPPAAVAAMVSMLGASGSASGRE